MKLSIIIVNFNVQHFLEQCLTSVVKGCVNIDAEIFVVDNLSTDDSVKMVKQCFPEVHLIANQENVGFSRANNQALALAKGEYVLLLNPDTVVEEDTFEKCIGFMDQHSDAGGLGVKMIDGNGNFLPESKRGLPTPATSFYKIFGLSKLFPKSRTFAKYHLKYLDEDTVNEIEILSGAYMWMRKSVLDKIGFLDERFFMYGEDIDLSYRILKAGYKNYYFPKARIIHYKGESTKKRSVNYVFVFYKAMIIFAKKHFAKNAKMFSFSINIAIYFRAFMSILIRFIRTLKLPLIDISLMLLGLLFLNTLKPYLGFPNQLTLTNNYSVLNVVAVLSAIVIGLTLSKSYVKNISISRTFFGLGIGAVLLYLVNLMFPAQYSFSNKYLISIVSIIFLIIPTSRILLFYFKKIRLARNKRSTLIVGEKEHTTFINSYLLNYDNDIPVLHVCGRGKLKQDEKKDYIGMLYQLHDLTEIYRATNVIFSSDNLSYKEIISAMLAANNHNIDYKTTLNNRLIIGGKSVEKISKK